METTILTYQLIISYANFVPVNILKVKNILYKPFEISSIYFVYFVYVSVCMCVCARTHVGEGSM